MIKNKCIAVYLLILATLFSSNAISEKKKIILGTEGAYAPFNSMNAKGELIGFDIEIGNALCKAMDAECEWVTSDWDGIIPALVAKKFDAIIASMSITDERKQKIDFTGKYYTSPVSFAAYKKAAGSKSAVYGPTIDDKKYLGEGIGIGVRKGETQLADALNKAIAKIRADGTYKKINDKYFAFDVYGAQ